MEGIASSLRRSPSRLVRAMSPTFRKVLSVTPDVATKADKPNALIRFARECRCEKKDPDVPWFGLPIGNVVLLSGRMLSCDDVR